MFRELGRLLTPFRQGFAWCVLLTFLRQLLTVGGGYGFVLLIRTYEHDPLKSVLSAFVLLVAWKLLMAVLDQYIGWRFAKDVGFSLFSHLSTSVFSTLLSLDQRWHQSGSSGARRGEVTHGVSKFAQTTESLARELCPLVTGGVVTLFLLHSYVSPMFWAVVLPGTSVTFFWLSLQQERVCRAYRVERYKQYASDYSLSIESMEMRADVVRYNQEARITKEYEHIHQRIRDNGLAEAKIQGWFGLAKSIVILALQGWLVLYWMGLLSAHSLDGAMLVYLYMLSDQLCGSFSGYAGLFGRIGEAWAPIQSFLKISSTSIAVAQMAGDLAAPVPEYVSLEFRDVNFSYRSDEPILNRLNLSLEGGRKVGFIGRTGCGKSTLLKLVDRLYEAQAGSVLVGGKDVREWPLRQLQQICTCLSQNGGVFFSEATLLDTIRFAKPHASFTEVMDAAKLACIHHEIMALQDGYQTRAGEHGKNLSGGQRQRIALAQALLSLRCSTKKVVLLDECTSNLDQETEAQILRNIWPYLDGKTVIIVTHRLAAIEHLVDRIVEIDQGRVATRLPMMPVFVPPQPAPCRC